VIRVNSVSPNRKWAVIKVATGEVVSMNRNDWAYFPRKADALEVAKRMNENARYVND
jgi:hypothetical protein